MHWPFFVASRISLSSEQVWTEIIDSPSAGFIAILPFLLILKKSDKLFLLIPPVEVANITYKSFQSSSFSDRGIIVVITSPSDKGKRFIKALPFAWGLEIGRR